GARQPRRSGGSRELLLQGVAASAAPTGASAGEGWGGVFLRSARTVSTPLPASLPSQGRGKKLAASAAPTWASARLGVAPASRPGAAHRSGVAGSTSVNAASLSPFR